MHDHGDWELISDEGTTHTMSPYLFTRTTGFFVLFKEVHLHSTGAFVAALFVSAAFAFTATIFSQISHMYEIRALRSSNFFSKAVGAILFGFRQTLHYIAMLIVMTMNVWLIIAVVVGHLLGWFLYSLFIYKHVCPDLQRVPLKRDQELDR